MQEGGSCNHHAGRMSGLYTHCYGHALNLAVGDTVKQSKICKDALDTAFEITRMIKFSPKVMAAPVLLEFCHT